MKTSLLRISILILWLSLSSQVFAAEECSIANWPPPELANYIREMRANTDALRSRYATNNCGSTYQSPMTTYKKSLSTYDKAVWQVPIMNDVVADFAYNISSIVAVNTPSMVFEHGRLLYTLEKNTLLPALDILASRCQLDGQAEQEMIALLTINKDMQDYFKWVVAGTKWKAGDTDRTKQAIFDSYAPEKMAKCKKNTDISVMLQKMQEKIGWFGSDIDEATKNWKEAIALFQWETTNTTKTYVDIQRQLLQKELERQWLSREAIQKTMRIYNCVQSKMGTEWWLSEWARARVACMEQPLLWYEKLQKTLEWLKFKEKDTDAFITRDEKVTKRILEDTSILEVYGQVKTVAESMQDEDDTTNTIITSLVNIHVQLMSASEFLGKRIPAMEANCMKWSPGINCYFR